MISKTEVSAPYRHVRLKIFNEFPKVLDQVSMEVRKQKDQYSISFESRVDNSLEEIENFNRLFQLGEKERKAVKWGWEQEMGDTMLRGVNTCTRASQFQRLAADTFIDT